MNLLTIEDIDPQGKTIFLRSDINSPIDPVTGNILDKSRLVEASKTIRDLRSSKLVVASHQGRLAKSDYVSMNEHVKVLSKLLDFKVDFISDVFGPAAINAIKGMRNGDILLLDNLRFTAEENSEFSPDQAAKTQLVQRLSPHFDGCVIDAFSTAHRAHPSIIGFAEVMPACPGRIVEREVTSLSSISEEKNTKFTTVLGGAKIPDRLSAIQTLLKANRVNKVLVGGLVGNTFLRATNKISSTSSSVTDEKSIVTARNLLERYPDKFELPVDVAVDMDGDRREVGLDELKPDQKILDIGRISIEKYSKIIEKSQDILMTGPAGMFERNGFDIGTNELLSAVAECDGRSITSGGHLSAALERLNLRSKIYHVSTAGGALVLFLSGKRLPLIDALERSANQFRK